MKETIPAVATVAAVPEKVLYNEKKITAFTGDGVKDVLDLLQDEIATFTDMDGAGNVVANGKTVTVTYKVTMTVESADLS